MDKKDKNDSILVKWIKRVFSLNGLALVVSSIATYYTYQQFVNSRSIEPLIVLINDEEKKDYSNKKYFSELKLMYSSDFKDAELHFPCLLNKSNKTINNLEVSIALLSESELDFKESNNYDIISQNYRNGNTSALFKYKKNTLNSGDYLYLFPIKDCDFPDNGPLDIILQSRITGEGIKEPINLMYEIWLFPRQYIEYSGVINNEDFIIKYPEVKSKFFLWSSYYASLYLPGDFGDHPDYEPTYKDLLFIYNDTLITNFNEFELDCTPKIENIKDFGTIRVLDDQLPIGSLDYLSL